MPNWAFNYLVVSGPRPALESFANENRIDESPLSFAAKVPMPSALEGIISGHRDIGGRKVTHWRGEGDDAVEVPPEELAALRREHGATDWYEWHTSNWGTKWDLSSVEMEDHGDEITYRFDTAWSPPLEWFGRIVSMYPDLNFEMRYAEEQGFVFAGRIYGSGGLITQHDEWEGLDAAKYALEEFGYDSSVECSVCSGHGTVAGGLLDDTEVDCAECNGEGFVELSSTL